MAQRGAQDALAAGESSVDHGAGDAQNLHDELETPGERCADSAVFDHHGVEALVKVQRIIGAVPDHVFVDGLHGFVCWVDLPDVGEHVDQGIDDLRIDGGDFVSGLVVDEIHAVSGYGVVRVAGHILIGIGPVELRAVHQKTVVGLLDCCLTHRAAVPGGDQMGDAVEDGAVGNLLGRVQTLIAVGVRFDRKEAEAENENQEAEQSLFHRCPHGGYHSIFALCVESICSL